jgi:hypothetical protein
LLLKQIVFERLNTGGVRLSNQEIRNSLYHGEFNKMLFRLAGNPLFRRALGLPPPTHDEEDHPSEELLRCRIYRNMDDVEIVLRFFALRHHERYQRGMQGFLDLYMIRSREFDERSRNVLRDLFERTIKLADAIYGKRLFRPYLLRKEKWSKHPQKAFADAVLVGLSEHLHHTDQLIRNKERVLEATRDMFLEHADGTFTGRGNTKQDVQERITLYSNMVSRICSG